MRVNSAVSVPALTFVLALLFLGLALAGCGASGATGNNADQQIPSDAEIIKGLTSDKNTITDQDEDLLELRHWRYGADTGQSAQGTIITYQLVTDEQMDYIIENLIEGGYLSEQPQDEYTFRSALQNFQKDRGLVANGELDAGTLEALLNNDL
jgi:hypothetical protein